ncbi:MAG: type II secretion system F family protein [Nocardioidaceae bacterium]
MGAVLGLMLGVGLLLIWQAATNPRAPHARRRPALAQRLDQLLHAAGIDNVTPLGLVSLCLLSAVLAFLVMVAISGTPPVAVAFAAIAGYGPIGMVRGRVRRRRRELAEVWPEAVDNLASAVRAGLSLPEAVTQLGERGPQPLRAPFTAFGQDYVASGRFGDCLDRLKERLSDPVGDRVIEALRMAREVGGGDLGRMLRSLSHFLRDDARTRAELEARQAWVVNGARLAAAAPWAVLLALSLQAEVIGRYRSTAGVVVLCVGVVVCLVAYRLMVLLGRLPAERRVLQ